MGPRVHVVAKAKPSAMDQRGSGPLRKRRGKRLPPVPPPSFPTSGTRSEAEARAAADRAQGEEGSACSCDGGGVGDGGAKAKVLSVAEAHDHDAMFRAIEANMKLVAAADDSLREEVEDTRAMIRTARIDECLRRAASLPPPSDGETEERFPTSRDGSDVNPASGDGLVVEAAVKQESGEDEDDDAVEIPAEFYRWSQLFSSAEEKALTEAERTEGYADVRGLRLLSPFASSPEDCGRLAAVRGAMEKIPAKEKGAFLAAQAVNPLLLETSPHMRLWLGAADFDPDRAARRVAQYWERRKAALGRVAFLSGSVAAPSDADFLRLYRQWRTNDDPDAWKRANGAIASCLSDWVQSKVASLNEEINKMPPNKKDSLDEAWNFKSSGQTDQARALLFGVQVQFLQSVDFQVSLAAWKMAEYSEVKSYLLGHEQRHGQKYDRNDDLFPSGFTLETLYEEHQAEIELGFIRILPGLDSAGRVVCFCDVERLTRGGYSRRRLSRFMWYVFHMAIESRSRRDNGIVIICNCRGVSPLQVDYKLFGVTVRIIESLPVVIRAVHDCFDVVPWWFQTFVAPMKKWVFGRKLRARYLVHGGREETLCHFEACGIERDVLPAVLGGFANPESWKAVLDERRGAGL